jgi:hypothetical protein
MGDGAVVGPGAGGLYCKRVALSVSPFLFLYRGCCKLHAGAGDLLPCMSVVCQSQHIHQATACANHSLSSALPPSFQGDVIKRPSWYANRWSRIIVSAAARSGSCPHGWQCMRLLKTECQRHLRCLVRILLQCSGRT